MTKVSIIIPIYNSEKYLHKCLESIIGQTLRDIEILCINDGSTDNSLAILNGYASKDPRINVVSQENKGQSAARNNGIKIAKGEYIGFIDSDDWVDLNFFEKLYSSATEFDADIAEAGIKKETTSKTIEMLKYKKTQTFTNTYDKLKISQVPRHCYVWNKIFKTQKIKDSNLTFKEGVVYEDIIYIVKALHKMDKLITVPKIFYHYCFNKDSTVNTKSKKNNTDYNYAQNFIYEYAKENNFIIPELCIGKDLSKTYYKFIGIVILKLCEWKRVKKYYLFGMLPVLTIEIKIHGER